MRWREGLLPRVLGWAVHASAAPMERGEGSSLGERNDRRSSRILLRARVPGPLCEAESCNAHKRRRSSQRFNAGGRSFVGIRTSKADAPNSESLLRSPSLNGSAAASADSVCAGGRVPRAAAAAAASSRVSANMPSSACAWLSRCRTNEPSAQADAAAATAAAAGSAKAARAATWAWAGAAVAGASSARRRDWRNFRRCASRCMQADR
jgi:hypothetical protein